MENLSVHSRCPHVSVCGGCKRQQTSYADQIQEKQKSIENLFAEPIQNGAVLFPIIPCDDPWEYRNKMEYTFSQNRAGDRFLGLMLSASRRGHVFNVEECHLAPPWFTDVLGEVRSWWVESGIQAYYTYKDEGSLRTLILREGKRTGDKMAMLTVSGNPAFALDKTQISSFVEVVKRALPETEWANLSVFLRIHQIAKGTPTQFFELHLHGPAHIKECLNIKNTQLNFKISPTSFFQTNTEQAEKLYARAIEMLELSGKEHVFDLYCGTATLSMALALAAEKVVGIELNPHAVFDAEENKVLNNISNLEIFCGDVGKVLAALRKDPDFRSPDAIVVDPPRCGLDAAALENVIALNPKKILYISCNPKTQEENIRFLTQAGYRLMQLQPVDQFPHTLHTENIALLECDFPLLS